MAILEILTFPNPLLRRHCHEVESVTSEVKTLLDDMAETMYEAPGIGLAASQVGSDLRCIVVDIGHDESDPESPRGLFKLVNPEITASSGKESMEEGCLSVPGVSERVTRASTVELKALNENGEPVEIKASGLLAVCFQHEIDHLNGKLFIDHLSKLKQMLAKQQVKKATRSRK